MPDIPLIPVVRARLAPFRRALKWGLVSGLLMAAYSLRMPNFYKSEARILPVESKAPGGGMGNLAAAAAAFGVGLPGQEGADANFVDVLNSRWLKENLLQTPFHFHIRTWRFGKDAYREATLYQYLDQRNMDQAVARVSKVLSASRDPKSKILLITAETESPELSQQIVRRACELLEQFVQQRNRTKGGDKAAFVVARLEEARKDLDQMEGAFRRFLDANRNYQVSGDPGVRLQGARLEMELKLRQQLVSTLSMNREQALLEEKNDMPILNVLDQGNLPIDKSRPARASLVLMAMIAVGVVVLAFEHRGWIRSVLFDDGDEPSASPEGPRRAD